MAAYMSELRETEEERREIQIPDESAVAEYYEYRQQLDQMAADFREVVTHPAYALPFLQPGRLVKVKYQKLDFGWGVIINYQKRLPPKACYLIRWYLFIFNSCYRTAQFPNPRSYLLTSSIL
jgi:superfamily II RNA helicase